MLGLSPLMLGYFAYVWYILNLFLSSHYLFLLFQTVSSTNTCIKKRGVGEIRVESHAFLAINKKHGTIQQIWGVCHKRKKHFMSVTQDTGTSFDPSPSLHLIPRCVQYLCVALQGERGWGWNLISVLLQKPHPKFLNKATSSIHRQHGTVLQLLPDVLSRTPRQNCPLWMQMSSTAEFSLC